jgi:sulfur relay (sulfurtransferase) DsrC/TusE family protein
MGWKCCVPGCSTGYKSQEKLERLETTFHKFPDDDEQKTRWIKAISREDFIPTSYSRVCGLHFVPQDFISESQDQKQTRKRKRSDEKLEKRRLRKNSVPSQFPNSKNNFSRKPPIPRSGAASSTARLQRENDVILEKITKMYEREQFNTFEELKSRLDRKILPANVEVVEKKTCIIFIALEQKAHVEIEVSFHLTVFEDLSFAMAVKGNHLNKSVIEHITKDEKFKAFPEVTNVIGFLKSFYEEFPKKQQSLGTVISEFRQKISELSIEEGQRRKVEFCLEQLQLATKSSKGRRYSPGKA